MMHGSNSHAGAKEPRKRGTGNIRRYANGVWQASFSHHGQRMFVQAISRDEANAKLQTALQWSTDDFGSTKESLHNYLIEHGFDSGIKRTVPAAITSHRITQKKEGAWTLVIHAYGQPYRIGAVSWDEAVAKYEAIVKVSSDNSFCFSNAAIDAALKAAGFPTGRLTTEPREKKDRYGHGPFRNGVRLRKEGFFEARYCFEGHRESLYAPTEEEAQKKLRAVLVAIDNGTYVGRNRETFCGFLISWVEHAEKTSLRPNTAKKYRSYIIGHFLPFFEDKKLQEITTLMLQDFINLQACSGRIDGKEGGLSHKTLVDMRNMLNKALNYAVNPGRLLASNPAREIELKFHRAQSVPLFTDEQQERLIRAGMASEDDPIAWAVVILLCTGMRRGELLGLQLGQIGPGCSYFRVEKSLARMDHPNRQQAPDFERVDLWTKKKTKTGLYLGPTKTESSRREFPVGVQVKECVGRLIAYQERLLGHSITQCPNHGAQNFLLITPLLRPYDPKTFSDAYMRYLKANGIDSVTIHSTRHSFITAMVQKHPDDLASISEIVGHSDKSTTLRYTHGSDTRKKKLMDSF